MNDLLYKLIPMILALVLGQTIYLKIDKKYEITNKINIKLRIKQEWKAFFCVCCLMISLLIIGILGIYVLDIEPIVYFILCGLLTGLNNIIAVKLNNIGK